MYIYIYICRIIHAFIDNRVHFSDPWVETADALRKRANRHVLASLRKSSFVTTINCKLSLCISKFPGKSGHPNPDAVPSSHWLPDQDKRGFHRGHKSVTFCQILFSCANFATNTMYGALPERTRSPKLDRRRVAGPAPVAPLSDTPNLPILRLSLLRFTDLTFPGNIPYGHENSTP